MAGVPTDQMSQTRTSYIVPINSTASPAPTTYPMASSWNTQISVSSSTPSGAGAVFVVIPVAQSTMTFNGGVSNSTYTARNCLTDISIVISSSSTFYVLDGNTTSYAIPGAGLQPYSNAPSVNWNKHWDHTGPLCGTAGNTMTLSIAGTGGSGPNAVSADGYTLFTGLTSIYNVGQ